MTVQLDIFESRSERDRGIEKATSHADAVIENWSEGAYKLLLKFLNIHRGPFQAEEVRSYAALIDFPLPPNARAWGSIFTKAAREGIIEGRGYAPVRNIKAHRTPARVWIQVKKAS